VSRASTVPILDNRNIPKNAKTKANDRLLHFISESFLVGDRECSDIRSRRRRERFGFLPVSCAEASCPRGSEAY